MTPPGPTPSGEESPGRRRREIRPAPASGDVVDAARRALAREGDDEDEGPTEADVERFGGVTRRCPECGTELYDDTELCWSCGHALASGSGRNLPLLALIIVAIMMAALVLALVLR